MGSRPPSANSEANTTTTSTSEATFTVGRDYGLSGQNAVDAIGQIVGGTQTLQGVTYETLADLIGASSAVQRAGFEFTSQSIQQNAVLFDRTASRAEDTLNGVINATRDFAQRAIAGSTGQATPLQSLPAARNETATIGSGPNTLVIVAIVGIVLFVVMKGNE